MTEGLLLSGGYLALGVGTFFEGEAVLISAGALAQHGVFSPALAFASALAGTAAWSQTWFQTGRAIARRKVQLSPRWSVRALAYEKLMARYGAPFVVGFRFVPGMGTAAPLLLGASTLPLRKFAVLDAVGATLWAATFGSLGWAAAAGLRGVRGRALQLPELLALVVVSTAALYVGSRIISQWMSRSVATLDSPTPRETRLDA